MWKMKKRLCSLSKRHRARRNKYKFAVRHSEISREIAAEIDQSKAGETQGFRVENPTNERSCRSTNSV
jgi:Fe-S cluster assembly iron-binding protein IscA